MHASPSILRMCFSNCILRNTLEYVVACTYRSVCITGILYRRLSTLRYWTVVLIGSRLRTSKRTPAAKPKRFFNEVQVVHHTATMYIISQSTNKAVSARHWTINRTFTLCSISVIVVGVSEPSAPQIKYRQRVVGSVSNSNEKYSLSLPQNSLDRQIHTYGMQSAISNQHTININSITRLIDLLQRKEKPLTTKHVL